MAGWGDGCATEDGIADPRVRLLELETGSNILLPVHLFIWKVGRLQVLAD